MATDNNHKPAQAWHLFPDEEPPLKVPVCVEFSSGDLGIAERVEDYVDVEGADDGPCRCLFWALCDRVEMGRDESDWSTWECDYDDYEIVAWHPLPERRTKGA